MRTVIRHSSTWALGSGLVLPPGALAGTVPGPGDSSALHLHLMWSCIAVGVLVFGLIFYSILEFRRAHRVLKAPWHASTTGEILWTAVPFFMLVALVTPATRALIALHDAQKDPVSVDVSTSPGSWRFSAIGTDGVQVTIPLAQFAVAGDGRPEIVLPSHRRILLRLAPGAAVWSIPAAGFREASAPATTTEAWLYLPKSGPYEMECSGACAVPSGPGLRLRVRAVSHAIYDDWLAKAARRGAADPAVSQ